MDEEKYLQIQISSITQRLKECDDLKEYEILWNRRIELKQELAKLLSKK